MDLSKNTMNALIKRVVFLLLLSCVGLANAQNEEKGDLVIGAERFDKLKTLLEDKRIGLVVN